MIYTDGYLVTGLRQERAERKIMLVNFSDVQPPLAAGVLLSTAATDAIYVLFSAAVSARRRISAASWSSVWYLLSSFAVISYTHEWRYVFFAAAGSWVGAYLSMTWLRRIPSGVP
jgi:predicted small integral membrane protein